MSAERYTLDANILVYAIDSDAGHKNVIAKRLWAASREHNCILTTQTLAEAYNAISRKQSHRADEAYLLLSTLSSKLPVVSANNKDFQEAMLAHRSRPVHFWDAMLWATARRHGCTTMITENLPDQPTVEGVRYLDPFDRANLAAMAEFF